MNCTICGGSQFSQRNVLWAELIEQWQLSPQEVAYIDAQQGTACSSCGSNLRSIALANAIRAHLGTNGLLLEAVAKQSNDHAILEINEAGSLTPILKRFKKYTFGAYPQVDMHAMPYDDESFDMVVHSDTLEHVRNPVHALEECRRVLRPGGALCFTVPIVVGRLSRSREGLPKSFHGKATNLVDDYAVWTEFGADAWTYVMAAGFTNLTFHTFAYPAGIAILAKK